VDERVAALRRLLYCGEWIQSHALHVYLLHAPDFLGYDDAVELASTTGRHRAGLQLKRTGNLIMETWAAARCTDQRSSGRFYAAPLVGDRQPRRSAPSARDAALATVEWVAGFDFPDLVGDYRFVACEIRVAIHRTRPAGLLGRPRREPWRARRSDRRGACRPFYGAPRPSGGRDPYLTGPLAATPSTRPPSAASPRGGDEGRPGEVCSNPFRSIVVRAVELVFACNEALSLVEAYAPPDPPASDVTARPGTGTGATEAPRGLLLQSYEIDGEGIIRRARIVPPPRRTSSPSRPTFAGGPGKPRSERRRAWLALRTVCAQPRSVHFLCRHFLDVTVVRA